MIAAAVVQSVAILVLVVVTIYYARQTRRMAEEMRLQRLAARPFVVPNIRDYDYDQKNIAQGTIPVNITNVGTAAAVELELYLKSPTNNTISSKLPLLLPNNEWPILFSYTDEFSKEGEPVYGLPPPEGLWELKVTFKSTVDHPGSEPSEVILPVDLYWAGEGSLWKIKRHELKRKLANA